jgi:hypothetical protein
VPVLVALSFGRPKVSIDFRLKRLSEHLSGPLASDLVEVEHEPFAGGFILVYAVHRCILPADVAPSVLPLDYSEGRYTTFLGKSSIHNF